MLMCRCQTKKQLRTLFRLLEIETFQSNALDLYYEYTSTVPGGQLASRVFQPIATLMYSVLSTVVCNQDV